MEISLESLWFGNLMSRRKMRELYEIRRERILKAIITRKIITLEKKKYKWIKIRELKTEKLKKLRNEVLNEL